MSLLVVRDVRVFDGVSERPIERASVVVEGARIREVVVGDTTPPRDAKVLEGEGGTLLPGFVDMHSHLVTELGARLYLANGVTTVRFAGNDPDAVLALRESVETARVPGPRIFSLGPLLDGISPDYPAMSWPLYSGGRGPTRRPAPQGGLPGRRDHPDAEAGPGGRPRGRRRGPPARDRRDGADLEPDRT